MQAELEFGSMLDASYRIEHKIGSGANGAVYRATDISLARPVAIKLLLNWNTSFTDETNSRRFEREARVLSQLLHPNIVRVFSFGHLEDGNPYLVMEFLDGKSLRELIEQKKQLPCNEVIDIALQVSAAMEVAHSHDIIHRDLKPEHIMIE